MTALAPAPVPTPERAEAPAPAPAGPDGAFYGWIFLGGLAVIIAAIDPIVVGLEHQPLLGAALAGAGIALLLAGLRTGRASLRYVGAVVLWLEIAAGLITQISGLGVAPGVIWAPRLGLLLVGLLGWMFLLEPPRWLQRGALALALPAFVTLAVLWQTAPAAALTSRVYWLAADSHGTLYAADIDNGSIWVFDSAGSARGKLWPRHAGAPGSPGPGVEPAGLGTEIMGPLARPTPPAKPGMPSAREFVFCGLATDPEDHLYIPDLLLRDLLQFDVNGQLQARWHLPDKYVPAGNCVAATSTRLYLADGSGGIQVFDHHGTDLGRWPLDNPPLGVAVTGDGSVVALGRRILTVLAPDDGHKVRDIALPAASPLENPYEALLGRHNGEIVVTDLLNNKLLRYTTAGAALPTIGAAGGQPGQFGTPGSLAEDGQGNLFVSDSAYRLVQRFRPDGRVDAVWWAREDEIEVPR